MKKAVFLLTLGGSNNLDEVEFFLKNIFNDHPLFVKCIGNLYESMKVS